MQHGRAELAFALTDSVPRAAVSGSLENRSIPWAGDTGSVILCEAKRTKDSKPPQ